MERKPKSTIHQRKLMINDIVENTLSVSQRMGVDDPYEALTAHMIAYAVCLYRIQGAGYMINHMLMNLTDPELGASAARAAMALLMNENPARREEFLAASKGVIKSFFEVEELTPEQEADLEQDIDEMNLGEDTKLH